MANSNRTQPAPATWHLWAYHRTTRSWRPAGKVRAYTAEAAIDHGRLAGILGYLRAERPGRVAA